MTGILICDDCKQLFFAHGIEKNLPDYLQELPLFKGTRKIKSINNTKREEFSRSIQPKFEGDYCEVCSKR